MGQSVTSSALNAHSTHTNMHTHMHTHTTCLHACMHTHMHTHTHAHTHTPHIHIYHGGGWGGGAAMVRCSRFFTAQHNSKQQWIFHRISSSFFIPSKRKCSSIYIYCIKYVNHGKRACEFCWDSVLWTTPRL